MPDRGCPECPAGVGGLLNEINNGVFFIDVHHAKAGGFHARHFNTAEGHIGFRSDVLLQHDFVVHFVNMIARENHDVFRRVALDDVDVLVHRVGGALVPRFFVNPLARRQDVKAFVTLFAQEGPALRQMANQAVGFVLRGHADAANA